MQETINLTFSMMMDLSEILTTNEYQVLPFLSENKASSLIKAHNCVRQQIDKHVECWSKSDNKNLPKLYSIKIYKDIFNDLLKLIRIAIDLYPKTRIEELNDTYLPLLTKIESLASSE